MLQRNLNFDIRLKIFKRYWSTIIDCNYYDLMDSLQIYSLIKN